MKLTWAEVLCQEEGARYLGKSWKLRPDGVQARIPDAMYDDIFDLMGLQEANPSDVPCSCLAELRRVEGDPLDWQQHRLFRTIVGKGGE